MADDASRPEPPDGERPDDAPGDETPESSETPSGEESLGEESLGEEMPQEDPSAPSEDSPADHVPALQKEASSRNLVTRSRRLREILTSNRPLGVRNLLWATLAVLLIITGLLAATGRIEAVSQNIVQQFQREPPGEEEPLPTRPEAKDDTLTFGELALHPDVVHRPYLSGQILSSSAKGGPDLISQFRQIMKLYVQRMGVDDNFTLRIVDSRTDSLLEVYTLEEERAAYREAGRPAEYNWGRINDLRRQKTRQLVDKYVNRGIPREPIIVKWGRSNEVEQARRRDLPYIEYEIHLAGYLDLSLLVTEIGTVETFNHDTWVSPVGARSRYQMMPYLLGKYGINRYRLPTRGGGTVRVIEEHHPLLTMEPAFQHASASVNAVGHEIPGISAYHTGVGNIYGVLERFLAHGSEYVNDDATVMDAYMWAITEGFDTVTEGTSFGTYSRYYVASAYGALKAMESMPIDTTQTVLADRVELQEGKSIQLSELLSALPLPEAAALDWSAPDSLSLYNRFRHLNKHIKLPEGPNAPGDSVIVGVPDDGDVRLSATAEGEPVRFFLPLGVRQLLQKAGKNVIDDDKVFRFDHSTYPDPEEANLKTLWDRRYDALRNRTRKFGFTRENRQRLDELAERFETLAERNPSSHYRQMQLKVIRLHQQFWNYGAWEDLAQATRLAMGRERAPVQPPRELPLVPPTSAPPQELEQPSTE